jgi:hypothetical protein
MRPLCTCFVVLLPALVSSPARADGLLYRLPEDGSWVRFEMTMTINEADGDHGTGTGSLKMSSVGRTQVDGEDCRWIELRLHTTVANDKDDAVAKVLVPEKHLQSGASPIEHVARGWIQWEGNEPVPLRQSPQRSLVAAFLAGPPEDAKKLEKRRVPSKLGDLECDGLTGSSTFKEGENQFAITYRTRLHDKAPFGVVSCRMDFEVARKGQIQSSGTMALKLVAFGGGAESELPGRQ